VVGALKAGRLKFVERMMNVSSHGEVPIGGGGIVSEIS
jgi:hypothetical protein